MFVLLPVCEVSIAFNLNLATSFNLLISEILFIIVLVSACSGIISLAYVSFDSLLIAKL